MLNIIHKKNIAQEVLEKKTVFSLFLVVNCEYQKSITKKETKINKTKQNKKIRSINKNKKQKHFL